MDAAATLRAFLDAFATGDVDAIAGLVSAGARVVGPWVGTVSGAAYVDLLRADPPESEGRVTVRHLVADGAEAMAFYTYITASATRQVAQWARVAGGQIAATEILFDPAAGRLD